MSETDYKVLGRGIDGTVVYPAIPCEGVDLDYTLYVSKIGKKKSLTNAKQIFDKLPDSLHEIAYYKDAHLCDYDNTIPSVKGTAQLIMRYIDGTPLTTYTEEVQTLTRRDFYHILGACVNLYKHVEILNQSMFFHNDINTENIMYNPTTHHMYLIDFDKSTTDEPKKLPKSVFYNMRTKTYSPYLDYVGNHAYINDKKELVRIIINLIHDYVELHPTENEILQKQGVLPIANDIDLFSFMKHLTAVIAKRSFSKTRSNSNHSLKRSSSLRSSKTRRAKTI